MTNSKDVFDHVVSAISLDEPEDEIKSITYVLLEFALGITKTDILGKKSIAHFNQDRISSFIDRINQGEPIQYITGEQFFYGRRFMVNPSVLIPRPETELLIDLSKEHFSLETPIKILDIGTGSGCLAVTLSMEFPNSDVQAIDISESALATAKQNAASLGASVSFRIQDVLKDALIDGPFDLIVSNPPYVMDSEKASMKKNVTEYEPHTALFVEDENPLVYYNHITKKGAGQLVDGGMLIVEINEKHGESVANLFKASGFRHVKIIQDLSGKDRAVKGQR